MWGLGFTGVAVAGCLGLVLGTGIKFWANGVRGQWLAVALLAPMMFLGLPLGAAWVLLALPGVRDLPLRKKFVLGLHAMAGFIALFPALMGLEADILLRVQAHQAQKIWPSRASLVQPFAQVYRQWLPT
jgi:hypothetical protein